MRKPFFYRLGCLIYQCRWLVISFFIILMLTCLPFLPHLIAPFKNTGLVSDTAKSTKIQQLVNHDLGYNDFNKILVMYSSNTLKNTNPLFIKKIKQSLSGLVKLHVPYEVIWPSNESNQLSKDQHTAYAIIIIKTEEAISDTLLSAIEKTIKTPNEMTLQLGGEPLFEKKVNQQTQADLYKADMVAAPLALITLVVVLGTLIAALIPILLGGVSALIILTLLYALGHVFLLSIFTLNIALLLGLCLTLDYSLFIISRFRDELSHSDDIKTAVARTQASAGKAIFFSGLAVFSSISALLFFPVNILFSLAVGGLVAVAIAVIIALLLLPALLGILNTTINRLSVLVWPSKKDNRQGCWHVLAEKITRRPLTFFFPVFFLLLLLGYPFLTVKLGVADFRILPANSQHRLFFDTFTEQFNEEELTPIELVVQCNNEEDILTPTNINKLYTLVQTLQKNPLIDHINGIVSIKSGWTSKQYQRLYRLKKHRPKEVQALLAATTNHHLTEMAIISKYPANSPQTAQLIKELKAFKPVSGFTLSLTGKPVSQVDLVQTIYQRLPLALAWIVVSSYIILLVLLRSLFLPLKAILMNILSLSACYGALVLVFQDGYLHELLNFQPQGTLDVSLMVIIFCALFGFSMDYEVFLLTRIKESYEQYHNHEKSIIFGIEKSSRVITSAAIIVICICFSFLVADVLMVKAFGLGIAVAIFVDAFLIRVLLVPSTMTLLKGWNWYLPRWIDKLLPKNKAN